MKLSLDFSSSPSALLMAELVAPGVAFEPLRVAEAAGVELDCVELAAGVDVFFELLSLPHAEAIARTAVAASVAAANFQERRIVDSLSLRIRPRSRR